MAAQVVLLMSESEVVDALGSRTTSLHPEIKRHRAWWREILGNGVHRRLAERIVEPSGTTAVEVCGGVGCSSLLYRQRLESIVFPVHQVYVSILIYVQYCYFSEMRLIFSLSFTEGRRTLFVCSTPYE